MIEATPFLRWAGGKRDFAPLLAPVIEEYLDQTGGRYFEPFIGGAAMALYLGRDNMVIGDVVSDLALAYMAVRDEPVELALALLELAEWGTKEEDYYIVREAKPEGLIAIASRFIYLNAHCFNGLWRMNKKGQMNTPYGKKESRITDALIEKLGAAHEALKTTDIHVKDFEQTLLLAREGDVVYMDPPYDGTYVGYSDEGFCGLSQERVASEAWRASRRGVAVLTHNSDTEKVRYWYEGMEMAPTKERRSINREGEGRGKTRCLLISNRRELLLKAALLDPE